MEEDHCKGFDA